MTWRQRLALLLVLAACSGCAYTPPPPPDTRASHPPRARCLANPEETGTRPLFFLFCIETP